jgi:protein tyrosine/serine phosphatase
MIDGGIESFRRIMSIVLDKSKQPVLFHCYGGKHRTGIIALAVRYIQGGNWTKIRPTVVLPGLPPYKKDILIDNDAKMEYLLYNPSNPRQENFDFINEYSKSADFKKLVKQYQEILNERPQNAGVTISPKPF